MNLNPQNCADLSDPAARSLCQTLSVPTNRNAQSPAAFTGVPAADILVLERLSDQDLINTCASNKYVNDLCNNESFWLNRTLDRYSGLLGPADIIRQYIPNGASWKQYYIWLQDMTSDIVRMYRIAKDYDRPDLIRLLDRPVYINHDASQVARRIAGGLLASTHGVSTPHILAIALHRYERRMGQQSPVMRQILTNGILPYSELSPERQRILQNESILNRLGMDLDSLLATNHL